MTGSLFSFAYGQSDKSGELTDKFGSDKDACGRNYTIYYEYYRLKNYDEAIPFWQKTIEICPAFSSTLWKNGEKMYRKKISLSKNPADKLILADSLLWILDQRINYFGTDLKYGKGYLLGKKGVAAAKFKNESTSQAYKYLKESTKIEQTNSKPDVVLVLMKTSVKLYSEGELSEIEILQNYELCMQIVDENLLRKPGDKSFNTVKEYVESAFLKSGAADCDVLISLFSKQFPDKKSDINWINKVERQLKNSGCTEQDFYIDIAIAKLDINQEGDKAHNLAQFLLKREDFDQAIKYLLLSLDFGIDEQEQSEVYYELAYLYYNHLNKLQEARDLAKKATVLNPNWGDPYLLIGKIYIDARSAAFNDTFEQNTVLWAAIDQFSIAKQKDPKVNEKAKGLISTYSAYFPLKETLFFHTLKSGDKYEIKGWINESTTVRSRD